MTKAASEHEYGAHRVILKGKIERKTEILKGVTKKWSRRYGELD
jgi:hypothetical protein